MEWSLEECHLAVECSRRATTLIIGAAIVNLSDTLRQPGIPVYHCLFVQQLPPGPSCGGTPRACRVRLEAARFRCSLWPARPQPKRKRAGVSCTSARAGCSGWPSQGGIMIRYVNKYDSFLLQIIGHEFSIS